MANSNQTSVLPDITYETVSLRCDCGDLLVREKAGRVDIAEFLRGAIVAGWHHIDPRVMTLTTFWDGEVQIGLEGKCSRCVVLVPKAAA